MPVASREESGGPYIADIERYLVFTDRLLADLRAAIVDATFREQGEIVYAVDFSEIDAFVIPRPGPSQLETATNLDALALELSTLSRIFFGPGDAPAENLVLLPPHRHELRVAQAYFQENGILTFRTMITGAKRELSTNGVASAISGFLRQLDEASSRKEQESIEAELLEFLSKNAANLFLVMTQSASNSISRLKSLLSVGNFVDLGYFTFDADAIAPDQLDQRVVQHVFRYIYSARVDNVERDVVSNAVTTRTVSDVDLSRIARSSSNDALALAYVVKANELATRREPGRSRRLVLISRSALLRQAANSFAIEYDRPDVDAIVRSPQAVRVSWSNEMGRSYRSADELRQMRRALVLAERGLHSSRFGAHLVRAVEGRRDDLLQSVRRLVRLYNRAANLQVIGADWRKTGDEAPASTAELEQILTQLRDLSTIGDVLQRAARMVVQDITMNNALLAVYSAAPHEPGEAFADARSGVDPPTVLIWSRETVSTVGLYFYDRAIVDATKGGEDTARAIQRLLADDRVGRGAVIGGQGGHAVGLVETCLASSFIEAVNSNWETATLFADMALHWPPGDDPTPLHEAFYMRALCRRRSQDPTLHSLNQSISDIEAAKEVRHENGLGVDPRYLLQEGIFRFGLWEHVDVPNAGQTSASESMRPEVTKNYEVAVELFDRAKQMFDAGADRSASWVRHLVDVANARCYAQVVAYGATGESLRLFLELRYAVRRNGWDETSMPVGQLDTELWTRFLLRDLLGADAELKYLAGVLADRLEHFSGPVSDERVILAHLRSVERYFDVQ